MEVEKLSKDDWTPLHLGCSQGHLDIVKLLITIGKANINMMAGMHGTPLHVAVKSDRVQIVSYLLMHKADTE